MIVLLGCSNMPGPTITASSEGVCGRFFMLAGNSGVKKVGHKLLHWGQVVCGGSGGLTEAEGRDQLEGMRSGGG